MYVQDHVVCMSTFNITIVAMPVIGCWRSCDHTGGEPELGSLDSVPAADSGTCKYDILLSILNLTCNVIIVIAYKSNGFIYVLNNIMNESNFG